MNLSLWVGFTLQFCRTEWERTSCCPRPWLAGQLAGFCCHRYQDRQVQLQASDGLAGLACCVVGGVTSATELLPNLPTHQPTHSLVSESLWIDRTDLCVCVCVLWLSFCIIGNETSHCSRDRFLTTSVPVAPPSHCAIQCRAVSGCDMYIYVIDYCMAGAVSRIKIQVCTDSCINIS
jgi:hypothetical protein